jgi:signal transduction histidine kinase
MRSATSLGTVCGHLCATCMGFQRCSSVPWNQWGPPQRTYSERSRSAAEHMEALLQALLSYGRLVLDSYPAHPVDADAVLRQAIEKLQAQGIGATAQITVDHPLPQVWGNATLIEIVFARFLANAVKFAGAGVVPCIHVSHEKQHGSVRFSVQDNGIGIPPEVQRQLFGPFHLLLGFAPSGPGPGMGLLLAKAAAERMQATLGVESAPARGSRFWLVLPEHGPATPND